MHNQRPSTKGKSTERFLKTLDDKPMWYMSLGRKLKRRRDRMRPPFYLARTESAWAIFRRDIKWLIFGVPKLKRKGKWLYSSKDSIWRYYIEEWIYEQ